MAIAAKRKTFLALDASPLDLANELHINVSAVAENALNKAISGAKHKRWLEQISGVFAAQADWHQRNGHPLAESMVSKGAATWRS